jgi:EAL domain-containing protein (putative c-di-GMP-specific phosphodiesterase class I)
MLRAKESGGGRLHVFDPDTDAEATRQLQRELRLREAVDAGQFHLHYQPIVRLEDGRVVGVEPLARWDRGDDGLVPPTEFIPLAEETGAIMELGEQLLRQACRQMDAWSSRLPGADRVRLHPNLSSRQLETPEAVDRLRAVVEDEGLAMGRISFELTESEILEVPETVDELKQAGARVVMDDFGTGYSSLNYVRELPIDGLKLDMSFVHRLGQSPTNDTIVELILRLGDVLDLTITAEGIERAEQAETLRAMGCAWGQGLHLAPPMPPDEFERWLRQRSAPEA